MVVPSASTSVWKRTPRRDRSFTLPPRSTRVTAPRKTGACRNRYAAIHRDVANHARIDAILDAGGRPRHTRFDLQADDRIRRHNDILELVLGFRGRRLLMACGVRSGRRRRLHVAALGLGPRCAHRLRRGIRCDAGVARCRGRECRRRWRRANGTCRWFRLVGSRLRGGGRGRRCYRHLGRRCRDGWSRSFDCRRSGGWYWCGTLSDRGLGLLNGSGRSGGLGRSGCRDGGLIRLTRGDKATDASSHDRRKANDRESEPVADHH